MKRKMKWAIIILCLAICSCSNRQTNSDQYLLKVTDNYLKYELDAETKTPKYIRTFNIDSIEYLVFPNIFSNSIEIYDIEKGNLIKNLKFEREGPNAIPDALGDGYFIKDFNHIYITALNQCNIYEVDTTGIIKNKYSYSKSDDGKKLLSSLSYPAYTSFLLENGIFYIPQRFNYQLGEKMKDESPIMGILDTISMSIKISPICLPPLISIEDNNSMAWDNSEYHMCFDGENFIYSFDRLHELWKVNKKLDKINEKVKAKSRFIDKLIMYPRIETDLKDGPKKNLENACYMDIVWDKYRQVYYRFAYPAAELDKGFTNYLDLLRNGGKQFAIMILDKNLNVVGETLFPPYTYNPFAYFITKDGLYIGIQSYNPEYNEDIAVFRRFELEKRSNG